jgi:methionyl-tRNA formyltransferase
MRLVAELDAGPIYSQKPEPILPTDDYASLSARLQDVSIKLLEQVLETHPAPTSQPEDGVTYADKLTAEDRTLDLTRSAEENVRIVRALHPHIGARIALAGGDFLGIQEASITLDGSFEPVTVQPAGGRVMAYSEYLRGHPAVL